MAAVDPYSPCPCGSGQKFKWCCHKVEAQAERAHRLFESGQTEAAIQTLNEGLRKEPGNPWLLTRKAYYQIESDQYDAAKASLGQVLQKNPKHQGAHILMTQLVLESEGPAAGAAQLQNALTVTEPAQRSALIGLVRLVGLYLERLGHHPAALRHLELIGRLTGRDDLGASVTRVIEKKPTVSPWMKNPDRLSPPPSNLPEPAREQFLQALSWADEGLWSSAAAAFEVLSAEPAAALEADRNLGFCRLWTLDYEAASAAFGRAIARLGTAPEAVDLEAIRQAIAPPRADDLVEHVQLTWPLRDRERLLEVLRNDPKVQYDGSAPLDDEDPESPEVEAFALLDRPRLQTASGLKVEEIPVVQARVFVGQDTAGLETFDDGRLDGLADRFASLAEGAIAPAHPKTRVLDSISKSEVGLSVEWRLPEDLDVDQRLNYQLEQSAWLIREFWPKTPQPYLNGRTPLQAGAAGDAAVPLRAAVMQYELAPNLWKGLLDFNALRAQLGLAPEPEVDPATVDIDALHLARLNFVPAERLDDDRLIAFFQRARRYVLGEPTRKAALALITRPQLWEKAGTDSLDLHVELALQAAGQEQKAEAFEWIRKGRQAEPAATRGVTAPIWDMTEIRVRARSEHPRTWVPELAVVLERYGREPAANEAIMLSLLELGLVRMVPKPDQPNDFFLDSRPLQMLLAEFGPRVTTASGGLGVSATKGEIWTPGGASGGGGGALWTPGSDAGGPPSSEGKPRLIIPGR